MRAVIVDDEPVARAGIRQLLAADAEVTVVGEAGSGPAAVRAILEHEPDLLFLDIQMPEMNGFEVLDAVGPARVPAVIFVTAYDQFAVRAFEVQALDYLLKPFDDERFRAVLGRAKAHVRRARDGDLAARLSALLEQWESSRPSQPHAGPDRTTQPSTSRRLRRRGPEPAGGWLARIIVRGSGRVFFQPVEEIDWIEAADYYARLHVSGKTHLVRETLAALEKQLDPRRFLRVHRSAIVNIDRIKELRPDWRNRHELVLRDGTAVPLSRGRKKTVERLLSRSG
ncbi:MAG: LytTR family DNA-binding domain-containing protein [Gemmatimonadetes bacterium]|nr:LytTR family DNA-binding domain-containing protein [Gemmatimonadota bacterium]